MKGIPVTVSIFCARSGLDRRRPTKGKDTWYTLRIVGDSMSPDYLDGDIVLMDYATQPRDGDVVAALIDGVESTLKTYSRQGDEITLTPIESKRHSTRPRKNC